MSSSPADPRNALTSIPAAPGAYLLLIRLDDVLQTAGRFAGRSLAPGLYGYAGSARGPGGLRARIGRHLRPEKRMHWHIDLLTRAGAVVDVGYAAGIGECEIVRAVARVPGTRFPLPGFGSSDCRRCPAHLAALSIGALGGAATDLHWLIGG